MRRKSSRKSIPGLRSQPIAGGLQPVRRRRLTLESLEPRLALASIPLGALPQETGEFMLGDVYVTVVLMESNDRISVDNNNSENWTPQSIAAVKQKVVDGLQWWVDTLAGMTDKHDLQFHIDFTYADTPVETSYEPITQPSTDFQFWIYDFLRDQIATTGTFTTDVRAFNHQQRQANGTHWAFTIFVVNDQNDPDHEFASGQGGLARAFAYPGGQFLVTLASRPASTIAHETGHIFWSLDEYQFGGTASESRGYYNTPNSNAWNSGRPRVPSIMDRGACEDGGGLLCTAWQQHTSSPSSLAMLGWQDSDGDGVFDVLDVPHSLAGSGWYDAATGRYRFVGTSSVQTLPNRNPRVQGQPTESLQSDITIATISRAQFRVDDGPWQTAATYGGYSADLNLSFPVSASANRVEIRTIDDVTGITSPVFAGTLNQPAPALMPGLQGFVFDDLDGDGAFDAGEPGLANQQIRLVNSSGQPLTLEKRVEPDDFAANAALGQIIPEVTLTALGSAVIGPEVYGRTVGQSSTGTRVFSACNFAQNEEACSIYVTDWSARTRKLKMDFSRPVSIVSIDAISNSNPEYGRLEVYNAANQLLGRYTTRALASGEFETMTLTRPAADIAYAIATGHAETSPRLDNLRFGPQAAAMTNAQGAFTLPYVGQGDFHVQLVVPGGSTATTAVTQTVSLAAAGDSGRADFGLRSAGSPWQNSVSPNDVNNDGVVSPIDALLIINNLNVQGPRMLTAADPTPPFMDVNGDGFVSPIDVLRVVNAIEDGNGGEGEAAAAPASALPAQSTPDQSLRAAAPGAGLLAAAEGESAPRPTTRPAAAAQAARPADDPPTAQVASPATARSVPQLARLSLRDAFALEPLELAAAIDLLAPDVAAARKA